MPVRGGHPRSTVPRGRVALPPREGAPMHTELVEEQVLGPSEPTGLQIPAIGVSTPIVPIALRPERSLDIPPVSSRAPAAWYSRSPTPGEAGASVIVGHVDSKRDGPAV